MAKKKVAKRQAPKRTCEKCGKGYHPRKLNCPSCGAKNPTYRTAGRQKRKKTAARKTTAGVSGDLATAIAFVTDLGGLENAQAALDTLKDIKNKL